MYEYLLDNGMTREEYHWFGNNLRRTNEEPRLIRIAFQVKTSSNKVHLITQNWKFVSGACKPQ
jgi:hypothetical protein